MFKRKAYIIIGCAFLIVALTFVIGQTMQGEGAVKLEGPTFEVKRGPLTISVIESGTVKAREQIIIKNEVEGTTSIISLIPEGVEVKNGDLLVELDSSALEDQKVDQEIKVQNAEAAYIGAKEDLAVVNNQARSDVNLAELTLEFAKKDLDKYLNGEYPYEFDKAVAEITLAQEELARARDANEWSAKLYKEKYISYTDFQADQLAVKKRSLDLELAKKSKHLLTTYTYQRQLAQLKSDINQAEMALEREQRKAKANVIQAEASLKAKKAEYEQQVAKLEKIEDQIAKTKVYAPADGLVIYATSAKSGGWRRHEEPLEEGQTVREREELIYLRIGSSFKAEIAIHETNLKKVSKGLPVLITVDALQGRTFYGDVDFIAPLPDAQSMWMNPDLKVYNSEIIIDSNDTILRTGMSCQAEIIVEQYKDAIYVPIQSVIRVGAEPTVYVSNGESFEPRKVRIGFDNNRMIRILEGVQAGEKVLLNPPLKSAEAVSQDRGYSMVNGSDALDRKITEKLNQVNSKPSAEDTSVSENLVLPQDRNRGDRFREISPEQREVMRKRWQNMSEEEREKMRQRREKMRSETGRMRNEESGAER